MGRTEFNNYEVKVPLVSKEISNWIFISCTPKQNIAAERKNHTLVECAQSVFHTKELPIKLWTEAIITFLYVLNRTAKTLIPNKNPYEVWFNIKIVHWMTYKFLEVIGFTNKDKIVLSWDVVFKHKQLCTHVWLYII